MSPAQRGVPRLAEMPWPDVASGPAALRLLALPVGSTEQHGPHLPLGTDTALAVALAERLATSRDDVVVAPALPYGSSGEHSGFPGTLSIGQSATELVLIELIRSAGHFDGVVVVSAHGGNAAPLARAVRVLRAEGRRVLAWSPAVPAGWERRDLHAGWVETSLMLALRTPGVTLNRAEAGDTRDWASIGPAVMASGIAAIAPNGVLGDPSGASAEAGERLLGEFCDDLASTVASVWPGPLR